MRLIAFAALGFFIVTTASFSQETITNPDLDSVTLSELIKKFDELKNSNNPDDTDEYSKTILLVNLKAYQQLILSDIVAAEDYVGFIRNYWWPPYYLKNIDLAFTLLRDHYGKDSPLLIPILMERGKAKVYINDQSAGRESIDRALKIAKKNFSQSPEKITLLEIEAGKIYSRLSPQNRAFKHFKTAYKKLMETPSAANTLQLAMLYEELANFKKMRILNGRSLEKILSSLDSYFLNQKLDSFDKPSLESLVNGFSLRGFEDKAQSILLQLAYLPETKFSILPTYRATPLYPREANQAGSQGYVIVEFTVSSQGIPEDIQVIESTGHALFKKAAINAASKMRYIPKVENGQLVSVPNIRYKFAFALAD